MLVPSCIIFTQALRAGSSNSVLDGSLDGDVSFTNFTNNVDVMNITYCDFQVACLKQNTHVNKITNQSCHINAKAISLANSIT